MNQAQTILFNLNNLSNLKAIEHKCAVITDAEGKPLAGFTMVGKNHSLYRDVQRDIRVENMTKAAERKKDIDATTPEGAGVVIDAILQNDRRVACAVITGWFGFGNGTEEAPFDASMLPGIFAEMPTWQDKVLGDLEKEANFMPVSSKG